MTPLHLFWYMMLYPNTETFYPTFSCWKFQFSRLFCTWWNLNVRTSEVVHKPLPGCHQAHLTCNNSGVVLAIWRFGSSCDEEEPVERCTVFRWGFSTCVPPRKGKCFLLGSISRRNWWREMIWLHQLDGEEGVVSMPMTLNNPQAFQSILSFLSLSKWIP